MKLEQHKLLSTFAINVNLRRYTKGACDKSSTSSAGGSSSVATCVEPVMRGFYALGRAVQIEPMETVLKALGIYALETKILWTAFKFCFQFQHAPLHLGLKKYAAPRKAQLQLTGKAARASNAAANVEDEVGRCRLTLRNPS